MCKQASWNDICYCKMHKGAAEHVVQWQNKLSLILNLIKTNPNSIIDDTSVEKLLSWLKETAADGEQRAHLLHPSTNILALLTSSPDSVFSSASCASFSLKLAGTLARCDEEVCKALIECGSLYNLFGKFQSYDSVYFRNAGFKCAFFEGFSSIVLSYTGLIWSASLPGLFEYAINVFNDESFYVVKSVISFLKEVLLATEAHKSNQKASEIKAKLFSITSSEYRNCQANKKINYLNLLYQMFDSNPAISWELLTEFGGVATFLNGMQNKPVKLLQTISELCHQFIEKGRGTADIKLDGCKSSIDICWEVLKVTVEIAKIDIVHVYRHLSYITHSNENLPLMDVPAFWNQSIITVVLWGLIKKETGNFVNSLPFDRKLIPMIDKSIMPEDFASTFHDLEMIFDDELNDVTIWKKCLIVAMDTCSQFLTKNNLQTLDAHGIYLIQCWSLFICEIMEAVLKEKEHLSSCDEALFNLIGQKYLTKKCIAILKLIVHNGWFQEFSSNSKMKIASSLIRVLNDQTSDTMTLSSSVQLFGSLIHVLDDDLKPIVFANHSAFSLQSLKFNKSLQYPSVEHFRSICKGLPGLFEKLFLDTRWEVKDSVLELASSMVEDSKCSSVIEQFIVTEKFWLKSWSLLDADESYVRSASVRLIGLVFELKTLRDALLSSFSLEKVLSKLSSVFEEDDEAFPKRSIIDVIYRWLDLKELTCFMLQKKGCEENSDIKSFEDKVWDFIFKVLNKASINFDWEVKKKGVLCWEKILKIGGAGGELECDREIGAKRKPCIEVVCRNQGSSILIHALNDCDKLVCESAFDTLHWIRKNCHIKWDKDIETDITSSQDLINISGFEFSSVDQFLTLIHRIDFGELSDSVKLADDEVVNSPVSLLNDIIAAANANDDNLLDCY